MTLTRDYRETVVKRIQRDDLFALLTLKGALEAMLAREFDRSRSMLRDLVHAKLSFPTLAETMGKHPTSIYRMLGQGGNPRVENLLEIVGHLYKALSVSEVNVDLVKRRRSGRKKRLVRA